MPGQVRKGTRVPYAAYLFGVASRILNDGVETIKPSRLHGVGFGRGPTIRTTKLQHGERTQYAIHKPLLTRFKKIRGDQPYLSLASEIDVPPLVTSPALML